MPARRKVDFSPIQQAAEEAFVDLNLLMARQYTMAISEPSYDWPVAPSPRDIVDQGQLRASQEMLQLGPDYIVHRWPVEHALYVHEGYTTRGGTVMPARRWTEVAHQRLDPQATYNQLLATKLTK